MNSLISSIQKKTMQMTFMQSSSITGNPQLKENFYKFSVMKTDLKRKAPFFE